MTIKNKTKIPRKYLKKDKSNTKGIIETTLIDSLDIEKDSVEKEIEEIEEINEVEDLDPSVAEFSAPAAKGISDILFKLPIVMNPLIGSPKDVQKELDRYAIFIKRNPDNKKSEIYFDTIHLYMHSYLLNVVLRQFPYIKGYQTVDIYQESLIAIRFKSIPNFKRKKGMSFLNFSKLCIRRHLITLLNTSLNRQKDQSMNQAISLDASYSNEDSSSTFSNIIPDEGCGVDEKTENDEAYDVTKLALIRHLSSFEKIVLAEYLASSSYEEIAKNILVKKNKPTNSKNVKDFKKAVDNALLRIRKKATHLRLHTKDENLPLFLK